jgi:hypothetical protein
VAWLENPTTLKKPGPRIIAAKPAKTEAGMNSFWKIFTFRRMI